MIPTNNACRPDRHRFSMEPEYLVELDLAVQPNNDSESGGFKLLGNTLPHDTRLQLSGGVWDSREQAWKFRRADQLQTFFDSLTQARRRNDNALHEAPATYIESDVASTTLTRFLQHGPNVIDNIELLTLVLSFDRFLSDPESVSSTLFQEFGSLGAVLGSEPARLKRIEEITPRTIGLLKALQLMLERVMHEKVGKKITIGSWRALTDYLGVRLKHRQKEEMIVFYLDRRNQMIREDSIEGSIDHIPLYTDEVVRRALELYAKGVILVHNHPSGCVEPSRADIDQTSRLAIGLKAVNIELHDHFIVGQEEPFSFKAMGLI